ncbi:MAG: aminopeptidase P family protein [Chloroflexi bacterium]|jgi:Xaa-Pro aminopeptidase|nr:aminopeptidase P family protein [Chloroflexota bacterium]MBT4073790.1 aminopeptidase P family protein [Chloroflexota bacterium]MBT4515355.1 aminopeptidase P family protein [Chloroflexota bacterium]MBT6682846.1 aminopeptidase P family protein [Chloroflexota bacterium]
MSIGDALSGARDYLNKSGIDGWLLYDYRGSNPILWNLIGQVNHVTRPCWFFVPSDGDPVLLAHEVDAGRFASMVETATSHGVQVQERRFGSRAQMMSELTDMLSCRSQIAMEYSPESALPRVSRVDAGTVELVRSLGIKVISSGDVLQYSTERWSPEQRDSHRVAMEGLVKTAHDAFAFIGENINWKLTEHDVAEFIRGRFERLDLVAPDGPIVAVNENASDPHYEPTPDSSAIVRKNSLVLIDLWAVSSAPGSVFGDITWTGFTGDPTPSHEEVFSAVAESRDSAVSFMQDAFAQGRELEGWEVDRVARDVIVKSGFGDYFVHRLGHSIGFEVHSNGVNLDDWETHDTRKLIPGVAVSVEPGIYLPEFGVRSEIDVFLGELGPEVTGEVQQELVRIKV